ncbi:uncharacterized protein K441DRAFT_657131 [Cenococcum geophilum 1.58]|uniref:uncharacterized protein n=1 Tax=Cenococcum geophilum 1.58 TaxID=794803 RepID=UPI00358E4950|nr:hypothetical protein K441DRAFT_657131 [Cenococcum geophilum 1.58]
MDAWDDIDIDPEIAAAMGFSSFGNQLNNKKRKFNRQDTFVDASKLNSSGANSIQLGARQKKIPSIGTLRLSQQDDKDGEEWLDPGYVEESVDMNEESSLSADTVLPPQASPSNFEPINRANPRSKGKQNQSGPSGLAQFLARGEVFKQDVPTSETGDSGTKHSLDAVFPSDPSPTEPTASVPSIPLGTFGRDDTHVLRKGVRNAQGDVAYFLPSFVEDPWENQRKERK